MNVDRTTEVRNAIITSAPLTKADNGVLIAWLQVSYGESGFQSFGGYSLYVPKANLANVMHSCAGHFIWRVLEIAGVEEWSQLPGKTIRVRIEGDRIDAIGHIVEDDWFCPREDFAAAK